MDAVAVELLPPMVAFPLPPLAPPIETLALLLLPPKDAFPSALFGPPALASALLPPTDSRRPRRSGRSPAWQEQRRLHHSPMCWRTFYDTGHDTLPVVLYFRLASFVALF
ncbi:hypothetical protein [Mesorhizobium sp. WSM4887]|uniref:hypothetical protein n=1 Tax=Mesorhizobium sp. WSM4887 TaxID=3038543 RepID=UPI0024175208|nr:hypothetical protein [Mesorhizobium sp. WSM4887]MDG4891833.1 hypothetical protein [Mesorhizobium sp. WSM4887]